MASHPKLLRLVPLLVLGLLFVLAGGLSWLSPFRTGDAALIINDRVISRPEFEGAYQEFVKGYRASLPAEERSDFDQRLTGAPGAYYKLQLQSQVAEELIRRALIEQAAHERGIRVAQSELLQEARLEIWRFLEANGVPPEQIEKTLNDPKTYRSLFTQGLLKQLRAQMLEDRLRQRIVGPLQPSEEELRSYYQQYRPRYYSPPLVRVRHILIRLSEDAPPEQVQAVRQKIEQIRRQWEKGTPFEDLARRYSEDLFTAQEGGDYGWLQRGDPLGEEFVEAAFALRSPGEVSAPVRSKRGFHLLQLVERRPARGEQFEYVASEVQRDYILEKTQEIFRQWYEQYRSQARVEILLPLLAAYRLEANDPEAALRAYEELRQSSDDPYLGYYIARLYRLKLDERTDQPERVALAEKVIAHLKDVLKKAPPERAIFEEILRLAPQDIETRLAFARFLLSQRRWDEAARELKTAVAQEPENRQAQKMYGQLLLAMKEYSAAAEQLERALAQPQPETAERVELLLQLAEAYRGLGQRDRAQKSLEQALQIQPQNVTIYRDLGQLALDARDFLQAIRLFEQALGNATPDERPSLQVLLAQAYLAQGDLDRAEQILQRVLTEKEPPEEAYLWAGELYQRRGEEQQALEQYRQGFEKAISWSVKEQLAQRILTLTPEDVKTRLALADLYRQMRNFQAAGEQFRTIVERWPDSIEAWRGLGEALLALGQYSAAAEAFQQALPFAKTPQEQSGLWARILSAERSLSSQTPLSPRGLEALYQLARLSLALNNYQKVADYLRQLKAEAPSYRAEEVAQLLDELRRRGVDVQ